MKYFHKSGHMIVTIMGRILMVQSYAAAVLRVQGHGCNGHLIQQQEASGEYLMSRARTGELAFTIEV